MITSGCGLIPLFKNKKESIFGLEIGCYEGKNAQYLLQNLDNLTLYGVDPYIPYTDWNGGRTCDVGDHAEQIAITRLAGYYPRFVFYKHTSDDAVTKFQDNFFDFIFIDGLHTYEQVLKDCKNYYSKLKSGGVFSGHDYTLIPAVKKAVDEFAKECNKTVNTMDTDAWYWIK